MLLLAINNLTGIALNFGLFVMSLILIMGLPGMFLTIYYLTTSFRKNPFMIIFVHPIAIAYNFLIYKILEEEGIGGATIALSAWPLINIILSGIALLISITHYILTYKNNEN
jgi:hypothetical protein